jgi:hypothetical protein
MDASEEEAQEETGWKLVHGDVFRPPRMAGWLSVAVGTGIPAYSAKPIQLCVSVVSPLGVTPSSQRCGPHGRSVGRVGVSYPTALTYGSSALHRLVSLGMVANVCTVSGHSRHSVR